MENYPVAQLEKAFKSNDGLIYQISANEKFAKLSENNNLRYETRTKRRANSVMSTRCDGNCNMVDDLVPHSHVPYGNKGDAFYSKSVKTAYEYHEQTWEYVDKAIDDIEHNQSIDVPFVIANYGSSDGGVSLGLMGKVVRKVRQIYGKDKQIVVHYEDQAQNDFVSLFEILTGQNSCGTVEASFFCTENNVFIDACGVSFYRQCFPSRSVDLALSSTAFHFLKKAPPNHNNSIIDDINYCPMKKKLIETQSAEDWEEILLQRAKEMRTGGRFVLTELAKTEDGQRSGKTSTVSQSVEEVLMICWKKMKSIGKITEEEFQRAFFACCNRTREEHEQPFKDKDSRVMKAGLRLVQMETKLTRCTFHSHLISNPDRDAREYAKEFVSSNRSWSNYTFYSALSPERSESKRELILDHFYKLYEDIVAENPFEHCCDYIQRYITIKKVI